MYVMFLPTAKEIAIACAEIRAGWSPTERYRRIHGPTETDLTRKRRSHETLFRGRPSMTS